MSVRSVKMQASQSRVTVSEESYSGDANSATAVGDSRVGGPRQGYQRADHVYCRLPRLTALRVSDRVVGGSYHFFCLVAEASAGTAATLVALRPWHDAGSEERRVGKEGRSRGSPYHLKKKLQ